MVSGPIAIQPAGYGCLFFCRSRLLVAMSRVLGEMLPPRFPRGGVYTITTRDAEAEYNLRRLYPPSHSRGQGSNFLHPRYLPADILLEKKALEICGRFASRHIIRKPGATSQAQASHGNSILTRVGSHSVRDGVGQDEAGCQAEKEAAPACIS